MPYCIALGEAGEAAFEGYTFLFQCGDFSAQGSLLRGIPRAGSDAFGVRKRLANALKLVLAHEDLFKVRAISE